MEHEGMVHALEEIHRLLRPAGTLIEIHPAIGSPFVEVRSGGNVAFSEPDPGYEVDGSTEVVASLEHHRAHVDPGVRGWKARLGDRLGDLERGAHRVLGAPEVEHHAVAQPLH